MKNKKRLVKLLTLILIFLPMIIALIVFPKLPDVVPTHFGVSGKANEWGDKNVYLLMPILTFAISPFMLIASKVVEMQKGDKNYTKNSEEIVLALNCGVLIFINNLNATDLHAAYFNFDNLYGTNSNRAKVILIIFGIALILVGRILPRQNQNTLTESVDLETEKNNDKKYKIYRIIRYLLYTLGVIFIALPLVFKFSLLNPNVFYEILLLISTVAIIYSYLIYKKEDKDTN